MEGPGAGKGEGIQPSPIYTFKAELEDSWGLMALISYHYNNCFGSVILSLSVFLYVPEVNYMHHCFGFPSRFMGQSNTHSYLPRTIEMGFAHHSISIRLSLFPYPSLVIGCQA